MAQAIGGGSVGEHYANAMRQKVEQGHEVKDPMPPFPHVLNYLWTDFVRLDARRPRMLGAPLRIPVSEIDAYARLMGVTYDSWEVALLMELDDVAVAAPAPVTVTAAGATTTDG